MYIYFDTNGTIKEIVNDKSIRQGSTEANKIYCYIEGNPTIDDIWYMQKLPSGETSNEVSFKNSTVTRAIPYDAKRDMRYFKDFEQYTFYVFTLNAFLVSQKGLNLATIRIVVDNEIFALGELTFNVQENVINVDNGITISQYDYLLLAYASRTLNEVTANDLDALLDDKINAKIGDLANGSPKVFDTEANIEAMHDDEGIAVATDTGYIYVWNDTQEQYISTGMKYIADVSLFYTKTEADNKFAPKSNAVRFYGNQLMDYSGNNIYPVSVFQETYDNLKTMKTNGTLASGVYYRIVDYVTKTNGICNGNADDLRSAEHPFDIIVQAISPNEFSEEALAIRQDGAGDYFDNSDLSAWKLWYCFENDVDRFEWADTVNGKGVIYRMIDEFGNDLPYDFKNIQFKRYKITGTSDQRQSNAIGKYLGFYGNYSCVSDKTDYEWYFTFTKRSDKSDLSLVAIEESTIENSYYVKQVKIGEYLTDIPNYRGKQALNNIVIESNNIIVNIEMGKGSHHNTWIGNQDITYSYFKEMCRNNILYGEVMHTRADECFEQNMMGDFTNLGTYASCWNKFSHHFNSNTSISMQSNDFEAQCGSCKFPNSFSRNHVAGMWGSVNAGTHNTFNRCEFGYMANVTLSGTGTWDGVENVMCYYVTIKITNLFGSKLGRMEYVSISEGANNYNILNLTVGAIYGASDKILTIALADLNSYNIQSVYGKKIDFSLEKTNEVRTLLYTYCSQNDCRNIIDNFGVKGTISSVDGTVTWKPLNTLTNELNDNLYNEKSLQGVGKDVTLTEPLSNGKITQIGGMSYKSVNLLVLTDETKTVSSVTFTIQNGKISSSGTPTNTGWIKIKEFTLNAGTYSYADLTSNTSKAFLINSSYSQLASPFTLNATTSIYLAVTGNNINNNGHLNNSMPMLVSGSTVPTTWSEGFTSIRNSAVTQVNIKTDNLIDLSDVSETTVSGITYSINNGKIKLNGTSTGVFTIVYSIDLPAGTYSWNMFNENTCYDYGLLDLNDNLRFEFRTTGTPMSNTTTYFNTINSSKTFTTTSNANEIYVRIGTGVQINNFEFTPMLLNGSTVPTTYSRNTVKSIPSAIQSLNGYGWGLNSEVYNYVDFERKVYVKRVSRINLGALTYALRDNNIFSTSFGIYKYIASTPALCENYIYKGTTSSYSDIQNVMGNMEMYIYYQSGQSSRVFYFRNINYNDATSFKNSMDGVYLYYELATPEEIDISGYFTDTMLNSLEKGNVIEFANTYNQDLPYSLDFYNKYYVREIDTLIDKNGNPRFIEGNGVGLSQTGVTITQCKWSLSGTHLMIVCAGTIENGATIGNGDFLATYDVPSYVFDKIYPVWLTNIEAKNVDMYAQDWTKQSAFIRFTKGVSKLTITNGASLTLTADRNFRIQFDYLIDAD